MSPATNTLTYLRPEHFARIRSLHLWARLIVEGMNVGVHRSPYHGFSAEFLEYRPYQPGESAGRIDWRMFARSDTALVRLFQDETNLFAHLLLDTSASMRLASEGVVSKYRYASVVAASLAWILIRQRDAVGLAAFSGSARILLPPRSTSVQLRSIIARLDTLVPDGAQGCGAAMDQYGARISRRGMTVVLSDALDDIAAIERGLRHLRYKRQDVLLLRVRDPLERRFAREGMLKVRDMESGHEVELDPEIAGEYFGEGMTKHSRELESMCRDLRVDLTDMFTDEPVEKAISRVIQKRRRLY